MRTLFLLTTLPALACAAAPAPAGESSHPAPHRELGFELVSNKPWVPVEVNGSEPQWFILDTGCPETSVLSRECAERLGVPLRAERTRADIGAGEGVTMEVTTAPDVTLGVAGIPMRCQEVGVFPFEHVEPYEGRPVNGLLGGDFLRQHVVELDYARRKLRVYEPDSFRYAGAAEPIPITFHGGLVVVAGTMTPPHEAAIPCRVVIDTGVRTTIVWFRPFVLAKDLLSSQPRVVTGTIGGGAGGETKGDIGRIDRLEIGPLAIPKPTAVFTRDTTGVFVGEEEDGIVGGEILRRCKVTFDYPHGRLYLEPYAKDFAAFEGDMSGLFLVAPGPDFDRVVIQSVAEGTPASEAGLAKGDEIVAVDAKKADGRALDEIRELLRRDGARVRLETRRAGELRVLTLALRRLV